MRDILKDSVNQSVTVRILDGTTGLPDTGITAASAGLALRYVRRNAEPAAITPITDLADEDAAHSDGGIIHTGDGYYRVDPPDAAFATGVDDVVVSGTATGKIIIAAYHPLVEAVAGGTGSGARTVTVTVTDGAVPLEGAKVRFTKAAESYLGTTNASGVVVFALDDGTWAAAVTLPGYTHTPTTLVVDGAETPTYAMTAVTITPSDAPKTTGFFTAYDEAGEPEAGVEIHVTLAQLPTGAVGGAYDTTTRTLTSDVDGLVEVPGMFKGLTYRFTRGTATRAHVVTVPANAGSTYELPSMIGAV